MADRRPRARDLNIEIGTMAPGAHDALTDVPGVRVGHVSIIEGDGPLVRGRGPVRTGVTAVRVHEGDETREPVVGTIHTINGYGETISANYVRELGWLQGPILLTGTLSVLQVADALHTWPDTGQARHLPVVAECWDGYLNDAEGRHVRREHVAEAIETAARGPVAEGTVGAGVGMTCFGFKGGIGTASRLVPVEGSDSPHTVGVLVLANFGLREQLRVDGVPVGRELREWQGPVPEGEPAGRGGSIVMVLATDAPMDARQLRRLAVRCGAGLARTGSVYGPTSGDFVIAFSTTNRVSLEETAATRAVTCFRDVAATIYPFFTAVADATEEAILNALFRATTVIGRDDHVRWAIPIEEVVAIMRRYGRDEVRLPP